MSWSRAVSERVPLRVTLVAALLLLVTMALGASGAAGTWVLRNYLTERLDRQLALITRELVDEINERGSTQVPTREQQLVGFSSTYLYAGDNAGNGLTVLTVPLGRKQGVPKLPKITQAYAERHGGEAFRVAPVNDRGYAWRVLVTLLTDDRGVLVVAMSLDDVDETVAQLGGALATIDAIVLAALAVIGYAVIRTSLRRLVEVERTAQAIAAGDLTRRAPPGHPDTEVGRLSTAFNVMIDEIEAAFRARELSEREARASEARMRRFAADASHELRTPLTAIRGFAELYRQGGGDPAHVIGRIESHATRMGVLVDDLLLLARLDQQRPLERAPVDLLVLAADAVQDTLAATPDHPVELRAVATRPPVVLGEELRLRQVVGNLLNNAVRHTPAGTAVTVTVGTDGATAVLVVADDGPGLEPQDAARVFERFFRTDPSRTRAKGGNGLGLSIVQALVTAHGGTVHLDTAPGQGARFLVRLPLYEPAEAANHQVSGDVVSSAQPEAS